MAYHHPSPDPRTEAPRLLKPNIPGESALSSRTHKKAAQLERLSLLSGTTSVAVSGAAQLYPPQRVTEGAVVGCLVHGQIVPNCSLLLGIVGDDPQRAMCGQAVC